MYLKIHRSPDGEVVAACDRELLNTKICHGDVEICISEGFYGSCPVSEDEVRRALQTAENANLMGERAVRLAVELGLIGPSSCMMLGNVPHALIFRI
jgi:hypothetical protein